MFVSRRPIFFVHLCLVSLLAASSLTATHADTYNLQDIGTDNSNPFYQSFAFDMSDSGIVSGASGLNGFYEGIFWQNGALNALPDDPAYTASLVYGQAVNNSGVIAGFERNVEDGGQAFIYQNGATSSLNVTNGMDQSEALGINNAGAIVGQTGFSTVPFLYQNGTTTLLAMPAGATTGVAQRVNNSNPAEAVGEVTLASGDIHATLWKNDVFYDLGTFGGPTSDAIGVNDQGQVVGVADLATKDVNGNYVHHAFLWTPTATNGTTGTMRDLGVVAGGTDSSAASINNAGTVVGTSDTSTNETVFIWTSATGIQDIEPSIVSVNVIGVPEDSWDFIDTVRITNQGQIAGTFEFDYEDASAQHGYIVSPTGEVAPGAPAGLAVNVPPAQVNSSSNTINLTWSESSINETDFIIQRATGANATTGFSTIGYSGAFTKSYSDGTVGPSTSYTYRVIAENTYGQSAPSNTASGTTGSTTVQLQSLSFSPSSVTAVSNSTGTVTLTSAAPNGGANVTITLDGNPDTSVQVAGGATSATYTQFTQDLLAGAHSLVASFNGKTATATLTVTTDSTLPKPTSLVYTPDSVAPGASFTGTVTLSAAAPSAGAAVEIVDNGNELGQLTISSGQTTGTYTLTAGSVPGTYTDSAIYNGVKVSTTWTVTGNATAVLSSVAMNPNSVTGGASSTGTVTLSAAAPTGGAKVTLSSNSASVTVPASVTVAAGAMTATFTATTTTVTSAVTATITATYSSVSKTATLTVNPAAATATLSSMAMNPTSVTGGASSTGTVTLSAAAPTGGAKVTLSSNNASATVPASVTVAAGATTATFTATTTTVTSAVTATITATYSSVSKTATLTVNPAGSSAKLSSVAMSPTSVTGGANSTGTVTLTAAAPTGGVVVDLESDTASVTVPSSVTVAAGATTATFTATTTSVTSIATATITATYASVSKTATLTVNPGSGTVALSSVVMKPTSVTGGKPSTGTVTLAAAAPAGGESVALSSSAASVTVPASVTVAAGVTTATFTATTTAVAAPATVTITATVGSVSKTATLKLTAPLLTAVSLSPTTVIGGSANATGTVTLNAAAPTAGIKITLSSSNTAALTVPASVTVLSGKTSATFTATSVAVTSATSVTITAAHGATKKTAVETVNPGTAQVVPTSIASNPNPVYSSGASSVTVALSGAAPAGGLSISIAYNGTSFYSGTVAAGQSSFSLTVYWPTVTSSTTATLSATVNSTMVSTSVTILPTTVTLKSYVFTPPSVKGGATSTGRATLSAAAPAGGATVSITYNGGAWYTLVVAAGQTVGTYSQPTSVVTANTAYVYTATYNGASKSATLTATP